MKNDLTDHDFGDISALIRQEEEDGLAFFRTRNFRDRVETHLKGEAGGKKPPILSQVRAVPVLATVLVLIMAGIFFSILKRPGAGPPPEFKALASALGQLPGFSYRPRENATAPLGQTETSRLAESVRRVLVSAEKIKRREEQGISIPAGPVKVPRLSLDQKMEILFKERAIERALLLFKYDSKEV
ncbi:MAG: hypothetical protein WAU81_11065 [Candidatus Aminicenantales bacterium]